MMGVSPRAFFDPDMFPTSFKETSPLDEIDKFERFSDLSTLRPHLKQRILKVKKAQ